MQRDSSCFIAGIGKLTADDVKEKMDTVNILKLIRSEATSITAELPSKVCKNSVFFIDKQDYDIKDITADGNGVFKDQGSFRWNYNMAYDQVRGKYRKKMESKHLEKDVYVVTKTYFVHKTYPDFHRILAYVSNYRFQYLNNLVVVGYYFDGQEHDITIAPHGNAKNNLGYTKKKPSVVRQIKRSADCLSKAEALENHINSHGGRGQIPLELNPPIHQIQRVLQPVSRPKEDDLAVLMSWAQQNRSICREISAHPEPYVVIATDQQLTDIQRFATGTNAAPITEDPTFNIGNFYVTPISYRNLYLENRDHSLANFYGPILIHYCKTEHSYFSMFRVINTALPELHHIKYFGTDGERELIKALSHAYPGANPLRCMRHIENNIQDKIVSLGLPNRIRVNVVEQLRALLISDRDFKSGFEQILSGYTAVSKKLTKYLADRRPDIESCQLNGKLFYTNQSESVNNKLKAFLGRNKLSLCEFLRRMPSFFSHEEGKAVEGYIGSSQKYRVVPQYSQCFAVGDFNSLHKDVKETILCSFNSITLEQLASFEESHHSGFSEIDFSVLPENCQINVPVDLLKEMYQKASRLLHSGDGSIMRSPNRSPSYIAYSCISENSDQNYQVSLYVNDGQVVCGCKGYKVYNICSHAIAVAQTNGTLYNYIQWHRRKKSKSKSKKQCPLPVEVLTQSVNTARSGMKDNQQVRKRRNPVKLNGAKTKRTKSCGVDHETKGLLMFVNLLKHPNVKTCHKCWKKDLKELHHNKLALAMKIHRTYDSGDKLKYTFNREWAYFHVSRKCIPNDPKVHVCSDEFSDLSQAKTRLLEYGFTSM